MSEGNMSTKEKLPLPEFLENCAKQLAELETLRTRLDAAEKELATEKHYAQCKDETATTFMNQVKRLQAELTQLKEANAELVKDKERLDWLESVSGNFFDSNGFSFVSIGGTFRQAIDAAITKGTL